MSTAMPTAALDGSEQEKSSHVGIILGKSSTPLVGLTAVNGTRKWSWTSRDEQSLMVKVQRIKSKLLYQDSHGSSLSVLNLPFLGLIFLLVNHFGIIYSMSLDFLKLCVWAFSLLWMPFSPPLCLSPLLMIKSLLILQVSGHINTAGETFWATARSV